LKALLLWNTGQLSVIFVRSAVLLSLLCVVFQYVVLVLHPVVTAVLVFCNVFCVAEYNHADKPVLGSSVSNEVL
jgi:hypothetical protein